MNEKLWICVLAGLVFLVILFLRASRSGTSTEKQTPADEKTVFGSLPPLAMKSGCSYIAAPIPA